MKHIMTVKTGMDVAPLIWQLKCNPHLWNQNGARTADKNSPHYGVDDIWVRYGKLPINALENHESVWYSAADELPAVRRMAMQIMALVEGERLGGVLITRIPPGGRVLPHVDTGWHAGYYSKFAVQIESDSQQVFGYEDGEHVTEPGDVYWFNNSETHWVSNYSDVDRITLIICIKPRTAVIY